MFLASGSQIVTMEHLWNINLFSSFSSSETICAGVDQRKLFCFSENKVLFFQSLAMTCVFFFRELSLLLHLWPSRLFHWIFDQLLQLIWIYKTFFEWWFINSWAKTCQKVFELMVTDNTCHGYADPRHFFEVQGLVLVRRFAFICETNILKRMQHANDHCVCKGKFDKFDTEISKQIYKYHFCFTRFFASQIKPFTSDSSKQQRLC